ncbi:hypothetical protein C2S52_013018 [Perilla frutescens var. hirtella]|nr:hypothetical protein C2S52_013018 [Perilla frutescens var. hirtella]
MSTRTHVGKRVYNKGVQQRKNPYQTHSQNNLPLNEDIGFEHNHLVDCDALSSQLEETIQQNTCEHIDGTNEVQNGCGNVQENEKKTRGVTHMLEIWGRPSTLPRIQLDFDKFGRPIGPNRSKFCEFLGTIARNGMYCPLDAEDWHKMPNEYKTKMLNIVKSRYNISLGDEDVSHLINDRDERVLEDHWANLLTYWNKEEVKVRSEKNQDARSKRTMHHLTGKRPFAQIIDKLEKEKGRPPSRVELLDACYTSSTNTPFIVSKYLAEIEKLRQELPEGSEDPIGPNDLYAQVTGQDKPGRVRMFGEGVSSSDVWGEVPNRNRCKRIMLEQRSEILKMKNEIAELQSQRFTPQMSAPQNAQSLASLSNNFIRPVSTKEHLQVGDYVVLKSIFDPTKVVAKGYLHSTDPNAEVGKQALGENWYQVNVKVVCDSTEQLIRPYDHYQTLQDAYGAMVAWPCNLVTPTGCQ